MGSAAMVKAAQDVPERCLQGVFAGGLETAGASPGGHKSVAPGREAGGTDRSNLPVVELVDAGAGVCFPY